ncbi:hypothetical protein K461DRAFT_294787 [Myriangium duriaei CBS 260.36]|uniref:Uncharacterized protein n=1 Tax=Myriangium duriaei CBS 260.36 TaxID=1168546 RepID=A0A9P4IYG8_9PEZI|nr:hypothetical protein K461DRAFT_294787 [Myriangium duriaei CBS 260.36]
MAPIRRYLRITRYSVLEVRIYLEKPSIADSWLLSSRSPALPRVIDAVRPLVLPKLREENENAKKKGGKKKKATKDTVTKDDFEVSIFLTETSTSHALMTKSKTFAEKPRLKGGNKMGIQRYMGGGGGEDEPVDVDSVVLREEDEDEVNLMDIPAAPAEGTTGEVIDVSSGEEQAGPVWKGKKRKRGGAEVEVDADEDKKKKLGLRTGYEGFSIYGRILCLIVKRKGVKARGDRIAGGSEMLENWVSTQVDKEGVGIDDE